MSVSFDFSGKVTLITGSSSGIGASIALLFAKSGAQVVVTGRDTRRIQSVAEQVLDVSPKSLRAHQVVADMTNEEDIERLIHSTIEVFGKIDILVNSAVVYLTNQCTPYLEKTRGNIIFLSGIGAKQSGENLSAHCMTEAALDMFTSCIAVELGRKGINVNCIDAGAVRTSIPAQMGFSEEMVTKLYDNFADKYPIGKCAEVIDIANSVLILASYQASMITGTNMIVDGGHIAANVSIDDFMRIS